MDLKKIIADLREERERVDSAILALERLARFGKDPVNASAGRHQVPRKASQAAKAASQAK